jgi:hypothetical protein
MGNSKGKKFDAALLVSIALVEHTAIFILLGLAVGMGAGALTLGMPMLTVAALTSAFYLFSKQCLADVSERIYWTALAAALWPWSAYLMFLLLGFLLGPYALIVGVVAPYALLGMVLWRGSRRPT